MEMVYIKINADERKNFSSHEQVQLMSVQQLKVFLRMTTWEYFYDFLNSLSQELYAKKMF